MTNLRTLTCLAIVISGLCSLSAPALAASQQQKPQLPLLIFIAPAQPGVSPDTIKAGDVVDFQVVATSLVDATEMQIQVKLADGAELVSGELFWSGQAGKSEEKQLFFSVRIPATGIGKIKASLTISTDGAKPLSRMAQYLLMTGEQQNKQLEAQKKMRLTNPARKDSKGKDVIEYR